MTAVERELMLLTVKAEGQTRGQVIELVQVFEGKSSTSAVTS